MPENDDEATDLLRAEFQRDMGYEHDARQNLETTIAQQRQDLQRMASRLNVLEDQVRRLENHEHDRLSGKPR